MTPTAINIRLLEKKDLREWLESQNIPGYRANQIFQWLWEKGIDDIDQMLNLSKYDRALLQENFSIRKIKEDVRQVSTDGTIKIRYLLEDQHHIETVLIPVEKDNRYTVCVSSQVGCSLTCKFCATGTMGHLRNLGPDEIYDQAFLMNKICMDLYDRKITNIVYMGMGEPLLNYKNVLASIERITASDGLKMSPSRITVSTAGIAKMIRKLADAEVKFNLALSLHAATDEKRNTIMPINESNNLETLMESLQYFHEHTRGKISYEYIAFDGFNISILDAKDLAKLCGSFPVRINVIQYNRIEGAQFYRAKKSDLDQFAAYLRNKGIMITVRKSRGLDIDAACGQLANKEA